MPKAQKGVLVQCDASIKVIIMKIDSESHDYVVEDLDETTLLVSPKRLAALKARLEQELKATGWQDDMLESDSSAG